jgi:hypothetical protein
VFTNQVTINGIVPSISKNSELTMDPIVHCYNVLDNGVAEEVYCDQSVQYSNGEYNIKLMAPKELVNRVVVK